jgi:hypothetical protein
MGLNAHAHRLCKRKQVGWPVAPRRQRRQGVRGKHTYTSRTSVQWLPESTDERTAKSRTTSKVVRREGMDFDEVSLRTTMMMVAVRQHAPLRAHGLQKQHPESRPNHATRVHQKAARKRARENSPTPGCFLHMMRSGWCCGVACRGEKEGVCEPTPEICSYMVVRLQKWRRSKQQM